MSYLNMAQLIGYVGAQPELRYTSTGTPTMRLRVATTEKWKDRESGENREHTEWHQVVLFDRLAEVVGEFVNKGDMLYIEGRLRTRKWLSQDGTDRYTTEIVAETMRMFPKKKPEAGKDAGGSFESTQSFADASDDVDIPF